MMRSSRSATRLARKTGASGSMFPRRSRISTARRRSRSPCRESRTARRFPRGSTTETAPGRSRRSSSRGCRSCRRSISRDRSTWRSRRPRRRRTGTRPRRPRRSRSRWPASPMASRSAAGISPRSPGKRSPLGLEASLADTDGSETVTFTVSGLPDGVALSDGVANPDGTWTLTAEQLEGVTLDTSGGFAGSFELSIVGTTAEADGDTAVDVARTIKRRYRDSRWLRRDTDDPAPRARGPGPHRPRRSSGARIWSWG
jgi:hypothetical protein